MDSQGWSYSIEDDCEDLFVASLNMGVKGILRSVHMIVFVDKSDIQSIAICGMRATEDVMSAVAEYITRANFELCIGKFELDDDEGAVRFQSALSCKNGNPSHEDVERVVDCPILMFGRYGGGLAKCLVGYGDPKGDIAAIEG